MVVGARLFGRKAITLMELLITTVLLAVVMLTCASVYVTANQFLDAQERRWQHLDSYLAMEHMARRIPLGNEVQVNVAQRWIKVRWDYPGDSNQAPNGTPLNTADDFWIKYGVVGNTLRWRLDQDVNINVSGADAEVQPGLFVDSAGTAFALTGPGGGPPTVDVDLRTRVNAAPDVYVTQHTALRLRSRPQN